MDNEKEPTPCDYCGKTTPTGHYYCRDDYDRADDEILERDRYDWSRWLGED